MSGINSVIANAIRFQINKASEDAALSALNISSGVRLDAGTDAVSVGTKLQYEAAALTQAVVNAGQGRSLLDTAKGALEEIVDLLEVQKALAVQANDASLSSSERAQLNIEFAELTEEINRIVTNTSFNNKNLLDGSISGVVGLTSVTGQSSENYSLLTTSDYSVSGTVDSGDLVASTSVFSAIAADSVGTTQGSVDLSFSVGGGSPDTTGAVLTINGTDTISFGLASTASAAALAADFVAQARASTDDEVRKFTYTDNLDGTVTITTADYGDTDNGVTFELTNTSGGDITGATLGGDSIIGGAESITSVTTKTLGADRVLAAGEPTIDPDIQGSFSNFTATISTSGTQNTVVFTTELDGVTYTSQAVTFFGTSGFNSKGNILKEGQVITFYDTNGPTNSSDVLTDSAFSLTIGSSDVTISGGDQSTFETNLSTTIAGFATQLADAQINQSRDVVLSSVNAAGGNFDVSAAVGTVLAGIETFDSTSGSNAKGDIQVVGDTFGDNGRIGDISNFSFNSATNVLSVTIDGVTFSGDFDGSGYTGTFDSATQTLTTDGILVLDSATSGDGDQLRISLSNLSASTINLGTTTENAAFTDALDAVFGVTGNETLSVQVGSSSTDTITIDINNVNTTNLFLDDSGAYQDISIDTQANASQASNVIDNALNVVLTELARVNGSSTAFSASIDTNSVIIQNYDAAGSILLDTDFSYETTRFAESAALAEVGSLILAQVNAQFKNVVSLINGSSS